MVLGYKGNYRGTHVRGPTGNQSPLTRETRLGYQDTSSSTSFTSPFQQEKESESKKRPVFKPYFLLIFIRFFHSIFLYPLFLFSQIHHLLFYLKLLMANSGYFVAGCVISVFNNFSFRSLIILFSKVPLPEVRSLLLHFVTVKSNFKLT